MSTEVARHLTVNVEARDREGRRVLAVKALGRRLGPEDVPTWTGYLRPIVDGLPFAMLVDPAHIYVYKVDPDRPLEGPALVLETAAVLGRYSARVTEEPPSPYFLAAMTDAWLSDFARTWKYESPPGSAELSRLGLAHLLAGAEIDRGGGSLALLYLETNFPIGIAKGQDPDADALLASPPPSVRLAIPSICYMEAFSVLEAERKQRRVFLEGIKSRVREVGRDITSAHAGKLSALLQETMVEHDYLHQDVEDRLSGTLEALASSAEMIPLAPAAIADSIRNPLMTDPTDNLILNCILHHARSAPGGPKVLLSGNSKDFGNADIVAALGGAGVAYFARAGAFLGWFGSQATP